jgi:hypothetical protein
MRDWQTVVEGLTSSSSCLPDAAARQGQQLGWMNNTKRMLSALPIPASHDPAGKRVPYQIHRSLAARSASATPSVPPPGRDTHAVGAPAPGCEALRHPHQDHVRQSKLPKSTAKADVNEILFWPDWGRDAWTCQGLLARDQFICIGAAEGVSADGRADKDNRRWWLPGR